MNDDMKTLAIIRALAIYQKRGVILAIKELRLAGYNLEEALDILCVYDLASDECNKNMGSCQSDNVS